MRFSTLLLALVLSSSPLGLGGYSGILAYWMNARSVEGPAKTTQREQSPESPILSVRAAPNATEPLMLGLYDIESSGGADCGPSKAKGMGAVTCWQIKPMTAAWVGCSTGWAATYWAGEPDGPEASDCARKVLEKGREICRKADDSGLAHFYAEGMCMRFGAKPIAYVMDVTRAMLKHLM